MTARQLAEKLCDEIYQRRLARIGEPVPTNPIPFEGLPAGERQTWIDVAEAVIELRGGSGDDADRLRELVLDWDRYTLTLAHDPGWRDEMRRAVVVEMRALVSRLALECGLDSSDR